MKVIPFLFPGELKYVVIVDAYLEKFYMVFVWIIVFLYEKLYVKRFSFWEEVRVIVKSTSIAFSLVLIAVFLTQQYIHYSRLMIVLAWFLSFFIIPLFRFITKRLLIISNLWKKKVAIIGQTKKMPMVTRAIKEEKTMGYEVVGFFNEDREKIGKIINGVKIVGHYDDIEEFKQKIKFEDIIVAFEDISGKNLIDLLKKWDKYSETIRYIPPTGELISTGVDVENIGRILSLTLRKNLQKPWNIVVKSLFEMILTLFITCLFLPFFAAIAIAIKLDSPGPVFFTQERYGKNGKKINFIKFRSMYVDGDKKLAGFFKKNPEAEKEWLEFRKLRSYDPRITRVGGFLRKYSLDELPQLFNVLRGEMSLIGPRPYLVYELEEVASVRSILLRVKPGITGLWQISGRNLLSFKERLNLDEYYVRNWTFWLDIMILLKTIQVFLSGKGAY